MQNRLKVRRAELGLTQIRAARKAGLSQTRWSLIETRKDDPTVDEIKALARALRASADELFPGLIQQPSEAL